MIKIERSETYGWEAAIRGMRNPMNSWDKSDSSFEEVVPDYAMDTAVTYPCLKIGDADLALMNKLAAAGRDHSKYLRMITVTADVTAPLYWWKEYDTYKVGTVANSYSTMHKIHDKEFTVDDFSHEHLVRAGLDALNVTIDALNIFRELYVGVYDEDGDENNKRGDKQCWWQMIQLLPSSYNQKRTVQLNYAVLRNIYHARK